jgi:hypothetical protein
VIEAETVRYSADHFGLAWIGCREGIDVSFDALALARYEAAVKADYNAFAELFLAPPATLSRNYAR